MEDQLFPLKLRSRIGKGKTGLGIFRHHALQSRIFRHIRPKGTLQGTGHLISVLVGDRKVIFPGEIKNPAPDRDLPILQAAEVHIILDGSGLPALFQLRSILFQQDFFLGSGFQKDL